jgi:hypothetical protein
MYALNPVGMGGNAGGKFVGIDFPPYVVDGKLNATTSTDVGCLLYQALTRPIPSSLNGVVTPVVEAIQALLTALGGDQFKNLGCPFPLT